MSCLGTVYSQGTVTVLFDAKNNNNNVKLFRPSNENRNVVLVGTTTRPQRFTVTALARSRVWRRRREARSPCQ